jgi:hypothetical protein
VKIKVSACSHNHIALDQGVQVVQVKKEEELEFVQKKKKEADVLFVFLYIVCHIII